MSDEIASAKVAETRLQGLASASGDGWIGLQAKLHRFHDVVSPLGGTRTALDFACGHGFPQASNDEFTRLAFRFLACRTA